MCQEVTGVGICSIYQKLYLRQYVMAFFVVYVELRSIKQLKTAIVNRHGHSLSFYLTLDLVVQ